MRDLLALHLVNEVAANEQRPACIEREFARILLEAGATHEELRGFARLPTGMQRVFSAQIVAILREVAARKETPMPPRPGLPANV
ncbi:MAG: hypothetical protein V4674_02855 [Patescibacteria group bacterium]